jgi:hypothetical protein
MVSRRVIDARRVANGWAAHPAYGEFMRDGLLLRRLKNWAHGDRHAARRRTPLTEAELQLIGLAAGWHESPWGCAADPARWPPTANGTARHAHGAPTGLYAHDTHAHRFVDSDDQYQLHVDVFMPNVKFMVFAEDVVVLERGPFHYVRGSHRLTAGKARWVWDRSAQYARSSGGATRHINSTAEALRLPARLVPVGQRWCSASAACLNASYHEQQRDLQERYGFPPPQPQLVRAGTLLVADTSGFHFRGLGPQGGARSRMSYIWHRCGGDAAGGGGMGVREPETIVQVPRVPALVCSEGAAVARECGRLFPRNRTGRK